MKKLTKIVFISIALIVIASMAYCFNFDITKKERQSNSNERQKTETIIKKEEKEIKDNDSNNIDTKEQQQELDEDLNLTIEELRAKYPIGWFEDKYGKAEWVYQGYCDGGADERTGIVILPNGEKLHCYPHMDVDKFTDNEIKSIFVHFDYLGYNTTSLVEMIYKDLYEKKENSKWYHLKDFLYSKQVLFNLSKERPKAAIIPKYIPEDLSYFREFLLSDGQSVYLDNVPLKYRNDSEVVYKAVKHSKYDIQYASPRLQKIYAEEGLEGLKREAELTRNSNNQINNN